MFGKHREALYAKVEDFTQACSEARLHTESLSGLFAQSKMDRTKRADLWRKGRNKVRAWAEEAGVPSRVAKSLGDVIHSLASPPAEWGVQLNYASPNSPSILNLDVFSNPFLVDPSSRGEGEQLSVLEASVKKFFTQHHDEAITRKGEAVTSMRRDSRNTAFGTIDVVEHMHLGEPGSEPVLKPSVGLRAVLMAYFTNTLSLELLADPFIGHPRMLACMSGKAFVCVLPSSVLLGCSANVTHFVQSSESSSLDQHPCFFMSEGQALWCPAGSFPIVVAIDHTVDWRVPDRKLPPYKTKSAAIQKHSMAMAHYFFHDPNLIQAHCSQSVRLLLAATWLRAQEFYPSSFLEVASFKAFQAALDVKKEEAADM